MRVRPYLLSLGGPQPSSREHDVLVIGSGIAGLTAAVGAARRWRTALLTKSRLEDTTTWWAQGGIAAALAPEDSPDFHLQDTLASGAGLCRREAVEVLVGEGPARVRELADAIGRFDRRNGTLALGREGAHSHARTAHAGGDATGREVASGLGEALRDGSEVELLEHRFVIDLLSDEGRIVGAAALDTATGEITLHHARATVLASGGSGQLYPLTTQPPVATGDGFAMAYRAGAAMVDMEFVQFHPTVLHTPESPRPTLLLTEALRGAGAHLVDRRGERFTDELASRDRVVRAMMEVMARDGVDHVFLDARHIGREQLERGFPTVYQGTLDRGFDLAAQVVPVGPACHYLMGGVATDLWGRTSLPGLYASGEVASTGVHGANRLASNSLLEGLVFSDRIVRDLDRFLNTNGRGAALERALTPPIPAAEGTGNGPVVTEAVTTELRTAMAAGVGIVRSEPGLVEALERFAELHGELEPPGADVVEYEAFNLLTVATLVAKSALLREESRGGHLRTDFPERDDERWLRHIVCSLDQVEV